VQRKLSRLPAPRDSARGFKNLVWSFAIAVLQHSRRVGPRRRITDCQKSRLVYLLVVRDAQGSPDQRGMRPESGRANRRRCAR